MADSYRLNFNSSVMGRYGDGGDSTRPEAGRWAFFGNYSGNKDYFIPQKTSAERDSVYNNFPGQKYASFSDYGTSSDRRHYRINSAIGTGPCWSPYFGGSYNTPAACPSGFTDLTGVSNASGNPLDYKNSTGIPTNTVWRFYFDNDYGCPTGYVAGVSIRLCYVTADAVGYE